MATIVDVAEYAGVSVATVSRMMNSPDVVSEKTKKKIHKAMQELHYQPNAMARALQQKKSNIIGLVLPYINYAFFSELTDAVEESCHEHGYKLMLCKSGEHQEREQEMFSILQANKVDGILVCSRFGEADVFKNYEFPVVSIEREIEGITSIMADDYAGGRMAARELTTCGSKHPLIIGSRVPEYLPGTDRIRGFEEECAKAGVVPEICLVENILMGKKALKKVFFDYMERNPEVDGIFCTSDMIAAQLFSGMSVHETDLYRKIPVIGFDGFEIAEWMDLSTISQPIQEMGECAVEMLIKKIEGKIAPEKLTLSVKLIQRSSTERFHGKQEK